MVILIIIIIITISHQSGVVDIAGNTCFGLLLSSFSFSVGYFSFFLALPARNRVVWYELKIKVVPVLVLLTVWRLLMCLFSQWRYV